MKEDLVSIIMPVYNSEVYLNKTIESILNQTYKNWELIAVDDLSEDNSCSIIENYLKNDARIKLIKQKSNKGPAEARNIAINKATGRYIAFIDSDDIWKFNKLENQINVMKEKNVAISCSDYDLVNEDGKYISTFRVKKKISYDDLLKKNFFSCNTVVFDTNIVKNFKFKTFKMHEDYIGWLNISKNWGDAIGINESLAEYRVRNNSRSSNKLKGIYFLWKVYVDIEKLGYIKSINYIGNYIFYGFIKYYFN